MFNRSKPRRAVATTDYNAERTFEQVISELDVSPTAPGQALSVELADTAEGPREPGQLPDETAPETPAPMDHTATLRATRDAHQRAQEMFARASRAETEATERAEQILAEASDAADRTRAEAEREAAELSAAAAKDAVAVHDQAMQAAMAHADETARRHREQAALSGIQEGAEIRGRASTLLERAGALGAEARASVVDLTTTLETALMVLEDKLNALDVLAVEIRNEQQATVPSSSESSDQAADAPLTDSDESADAVPAAQG